jgi:threonylcarbamoyladenosine tRNA methylthiotransferase MtaB
MSRVSVPIPLNRAEAPTESHAAPRRVGVATLGCKVNVFESEVITEALRGEAWDVVDFRESADLYVVNTCTVTGEADRQARQQVRRAVRRNPDALVVVTGCYAQIAPEACAAIPGVDLVLGNDRKLDVHRLLPQLERGELPRVLVGDVDGQVSLPEHLVSGCEGHTRAFVQVQQGCDQGCTFCIIHRARGPNRSFAPTLVKRQVERLVLNGYREIVICGVDVGGYGRDLPSTASGPLTLAGLLRELAAIGEDFRIRLSSIDPSHIDDELIELLAAEPKLCPHLHLSLQSGNTLILKRMKRRYDADLVYERVGRLRAAVPDLVIGADVLVGFPTESEAAFADTLAMLGELQIAFPHVFVYSARTGTPAARIPRQVPHPERKARAERVRQLAGELQAGLLASRIGRSARVLVESGGNPPPGHQRARAADYLTAYVPAGSAEEGEWLDVEYTGVTDGGLIARRWA